jgi:hypothetical protein
VKRPLVATFHHMIFPFTTMQSDWRRTVQWALQLAALAGLSILAGHSLAEGSDTIYFKDGMRTVCEGNAWEKDDEVHCDYDGGVLIYPKSDVVRIEKGRSPEPEEESNQPQALEPPQPDPKPPLANTRAEAASPATPKIPAGIAFYNPRRPQKYWSSETRHHDTFQDAVSALAEDYNRPTTWIEENLADSNDLSEIRETLSSRLRAGAATNSPSVSVPGNAIEFYNPRRAQKYMTGPDALHDSFQAALEALARDFNKPADWVERHMGATNDVDQIRQNLRDAQASGTAR